MSDLSAFERWWLDAWPHRMHIRRLVPAFLKSCPEPFRGEVLEVGAGTGWTSRSILETFPQVALTATDVDAKALKSFDRLQREYGQRLQVREADVVQLPFDRASFDIVIAFHMMHHVVDVEQAIQQLVRVLRPGGLLGIADEDQRYVVGPMRWLWRPSHRLDRATMEQYVRHELEMVVAQGDVHYQLWARKAYPVTPTVSAD